MSKHKKKHRKNDVQENRMDINNLDIGKLAQMLSKIDIDKISDELSKLNIDEDLIVEDSNEDENKEGYKETDKDDNKKDKKDKKYKRNNKLDKGKNINNKNINNRSFGNKDDRTIKVLNALKPMVNAKRCEIIDKIIQIYSIGKIFDK